MYFILMHYTGNVFHNNALYWQCISYCCVILKMYFILLRYTDNVFHTNALYWQCISYYCVILTMYFILLRYTENVLHTIALYWQCISYYCVILTSLGFCTMSHICPMHSCHGNTLYFTICILLLYGLYAVVMVTVVYRRMDWSSNMIGPDCMAPLAFLQDSNNVVHLNLSNCQLVLETVSHMMSSATMMFVLLGVGNIATRMLSTSVTS